MSVVTISETRNLVLPLETVLEALVHFDRKGQGVLLHGEVLQAKIISGSKRGDGIDVALRNGDTRIVECITDAAANHARARTTVSQ